MLSFLACAFLRRKLFSRNFWCALAELTKSSRVIINEEIPASEASSRWHWDWVTVPVSGSFSPAEGSRAGATPPDLWMGTHHLHCKDCQPVFLTSVISWLARTSHLLFPKIMHMQERLHLSLEVKDVLSGCKVPGSQNHNHGTLLFCLLAFDIRQKAKASLSFITLDIQSC